MSIRGPALRALVFAAVMVAAWRVSDRVRADEPVVQPAVSEHASPLEGFTPVAGDGHRGQGFLRKPPGAGPFPAVVWIHGGLVTRPADELKNMALHGANPVRFLAAGYVIAVITYRSRDHDPQSTVSRDDSLAAVDHLKHLPFVDPRSIVVYGCSGGGDLALEVAAATDVCAIVPEEPASFIFAGIFNAKFPKRGDRYAPPDAAPIGLDPKRYYTPEYRAIARAKIERIRCPILILQGDQGTGVVPFNNEILIPELRAAGKTVEVISYPGEPHCFAFYGSGGRTPRPAAALKAFQDTDTFSRRYLKTQPKPIDSSLVKTVPVSAR